MSLFKKFVKSNNQQTSSNSNSSIHTNEEKSKTAKLEDQIKHLNNYIKELVKENEMLQDRNNDMKTTLQQNKQLLGNAHNNGNGNVYTTTKATTIFYQTSPKNSAMTQYNFTTMNETNNVNTSVNHNNNYGNNHHQQHNPQQNNNSSNLNKSQSNNNNITPGSSIQQNKQNSSAHITILCPSCKTQFRQPVPQQSSPNNQAIPDRESTISNRRVHTFSQMFVEKNYQDLGKIQDMLDLSQQQSELILFQDSKGELWQIIPRQDLQNSIQDQIEETINRSNKKKSRNNETGRQQMISQQSDYEDDDEDEDHYEEEEEEEDDDYHQQDSYQNNDLSQRKRQNVIQKLQDQLSNSKNTSMLSGSKSVGKSNQKQIRQPNLMEGDDKNVIVSVLNTEEF
ncbi:UNKNOWN [Stylonychia lemnae]|uniref:Uncharacterized protein n=1 Tax=Stylonychia lemnae TaxID=5949 RepID=A0A078AZ02_STYLE|nr:UNKNOWN [Stylonychia lemnae]|eukprot:CDW87361.1 UNKNOWN [Stylonychia lemnae]